MANTTTSPTPSSAATHEGGALWLTLAYRYGFPAAVAAFLIYFLTTVVAADVKATRSAIEQHVHDQRRQSQQLRGICMVIADGDPVSERWCEVGQ
jgi:hypothetical protein